MFPYSAFCPQFNCGQNGIARHFAQVPQALHIRDGLLQHLSLGFERFADRDQDPGDHAAQKKLVKVYNKLPV